MNPGYAKKAIVLGMLTSVGPFAIDMYLPALPTITLDLHGTTAATQMTLMAYFITFGIAQLVYGPVSDVVGRKCPLYIGLAIFIIGSIGCSVAPNIEWLIAFRALQGVGAAASTVIPRAIVRDLHTGVEATRLMALIMLVFSVSPILAPLFGSALIVPFGWRAVFVAVTIIGLIDVIVIWLFLDETRPPEKRAAFHLTGLLKTFGALLCEPRFLGLALIGGFGMASFFVFLATSSFVYIDHYGLTPTQYSLAFSINAVGFIGATQFAAKLGSRLGLARVLVLSAAIFAFFSIVLTAVMLTGTENIVVLLVLLFLAYAFLGLVIPPTMVLALEDHGRIAGAASALAGTLQMVCGGLVIAIVSRFFNGTPLMMVAAIACCATIALILSILTLGRRALNA